MIARRFTNFVTGVAFALSLAGGVFAVRVIAQTIPGTCLPLGCFEVGVEGEIWQTLAPWGIPDSLACTNGDPLSPLEANRLCPNALGVLGPPPLGQLLYPFALAVDGATVYVSDQFNHRIQAFTFTGTPIPIPTPIGDGTMGADANHLNAPEGVAVDGAHHIAVADSYNGRIAVFNSNGTPMYDGQQPVYVVDTVQSLHTLPTGLAMSPGTVIAPFHSAINPLDTHRIVVTDRASCFIWIYDAAFNLRVQIPSAATLATVLPYTRACVQGASPSSPPPIGLFNSPSGVAVDAAGHIYVTDYDNSRIQILDSLTGVAMGSFGAPPNPASLPPFAPPPASSLQAPWAVTVTHNNRVIVTDSDNSRIAAFLPDFSTSPPTVTYQFQLNAGGTLNGSPTGIVEQLTPDPAGRLLVTDTQAHRVQRFQLPELAIARAAVDPTGTPAAGSFAVVVPSQKAAVVSNVAATVVGTNAAVVPNSVLAFAPANPLLNDILPGQLVSYAFQYTPSGAGTPSFVISATAANGISAPDATAIAHTPCPDCASTVKVYNAPVPSPPALPVLATSNSNWYRNQVVARISAHSSNPAGLSKIAYQFKSGPEVGVYSGTVHLIDVSGSDASIDVLFARESSSSMDFWAVNADGTEEIPHPSLSLSLDLTPPSITFNFPPATGVDPSGNAWNNGSLTVPYIVIDELSGTNTANGALIFTTEARAQTQSVLITDRAGNSATVLSSRGPSGGRLVNIDKTAPTLGKAPAPIFVELTGPGVGVITAAQASTFTMTATDPALAGGGAGSGVKTISNPVGGVTAFPMSGAGPTTTAHTFIATDEAGNSASRSVNVTVRDTTKPVFTTCPATLTLSVPALSATLTLTSLLGSVAATDLSGTTTVTQSVAAGTILGLGLKPVTMTATDPSGNFQTCLINLTVGDTTPPVLTLPSDFTVYTNTSTSTNATNVIFTTSALDNVDGNRTVTCTPASGSTLPIGVTTITCTAKDLSNNIATGTFKITVLASIIPTLSLPAPITVTATSATGAPVSFTASYTDSIDGTKPATCTPASGATFPIGQTTVTCTGTTTRGGTATGQFTVTVNSGTHSAPDCTAPAASPGDLWPPNHKLVAISVDGLKTADGGSITTTITSIYQNEPTQGLGDGDTAIDGYGVGSSQAQVRSERSGLGDGRVYYIGFTATTGGGSCTGTVTVRVPHDQGHPTVGQGATRYDSTKP